jgi:hypothetical protein
MPRCGLGRPGEVAVAPYFIEKIAIFVGGGAGGIAFILRPGGRI